MPPWRRIRFLGYSRGACYLGDPKYCGSTMWSSAYLGQKGSVQLSVEAKGRHRNKHLQHLIEEEERYTCTCISRRDGGEKTDKENERQADQKNCAYPVEPLAGSQRDAEAECKHVKKTEKFNNSRLTSGDWLPRKEDAQTDRGRKGQKRTERIKKILLAKPNKLLTRTVQREAPTEGGGKRKTGQSRPERKEKHPRQYP